jgi:hypothetical protein
MVMVWETKGEDICWLCGNTVQTLNGCYTCPDCDVAYAPGRDPLPMFTTPGHKSAYSGYTVTYIDHATVYAPAP